jgi:hypothetical protein
MMSIFDQLTGLSAGEYTPEMALALIEAGPVAVWNALEIAHANGRVEAMREVARFAGIKLQDAQAQRHCVLSMATRIQDDDAP